MTKESPKPIEVHYNRPQLRSMCVMAQHERAIWSRGTGKSDGLIAPRVAHNVFAMPRSLGAFEARSFQQLFTRTLPPMIKGLERLGYRLERDYTVGERGPKAWKLPIMPPLKWQNAIHFRNGSAIAMISQQNAGSANGLSIDWLVADEGKFLKKEQHDEEVMPAMRAGQIEFRHLSCHQSTLIASDMPTTPSARWLLDEEEKMDVECIELILSTQLEISKLQRAIDAGGISAASAQVYRSRIRRLEAELNVLRIGTLYFSQANALDNLAVLGEGYIARQRQNLPEYIFLTSIMNQRPDRVEGGFYPNIDEVDTYVAPDASYITSAGIDLTKLEVEDCRKDGMLVPTLPLWMAPDFGASFNCVAIGQLFDKDFNVDNQLYVKHPGKIRDLARKVAAYYQYHGTRHIKLFFDHTMIGEDAQREYGFAVELQRELEALGWTVEMIYTGQAPGHHVKYTFWVRNIANPEPGTPRIRFNAENTEPTLLSMRLAGAKQTRRGFEKNKDDERNPNADQSETTHLSDAADLLLMGAFKHIGREIAGGVDTVFA